MNESLTMFALLFASFVWVHLTAEALYLRNCSTLATDQPKVQEEIVDAHNYYRNCTDPPAANMLKMQWDDVLAAHAQEYADTCTCNHSLPSSRQLNGYPTGENIITSPYCIPWTEGVGLWNNESHFFKYGSGPTVKGAVFGHYTQVVWYNSYRVGCGIASCTNSTCDKFMVCRYSFAGNRYKRLYTPYTAGERCSLCKNDCQNGLCTNSCNYQDKFGNCEMAKMLKEMHLCNSPKKTSCMDACGACAGKIS